MTINRITKALILNHVCYNLNIVEPYRVYQPMMFITTL